MSSIPPLSLFSTSDAQRIFTGPNLADTIMRPEATEENILSTVDQLPQVSQNNFNHLVTASTAHNITPLQAALIRRFPRVVDQLLKLGVPTDTVDAHGWSAAHHVAIFSPGLIDKIPRALEYRTPQGHTPTHLQLLFGLKKVYFLAVLRFQGKNDDSPRNLNHRAFANLTGLQEYSDNIRLPASDLPALWAGQITWNSRDVGKSTDDFEAYRIRPPVLCVKEEVGAQDVRNLKLVTEVPISNGSIVTHYAGERTTLTVAGTFRQKVAGELPPATFTLDDIDASRIGSYARFANDGYPNTYMDVIFPDGSIPQYVLKAIEDIGPDEEILWDYGIRAAHLKWGTPYVMLGRGRMHDFVRAQGHITTKAESDPNLFSTQPGWKYIFNTPAAVIDLVCSKVAKTDDLRIVFGRLQFSDCSHQIWMSKLLTLLYNYEVLVRDYPYKETQLKPFILNLFGHLPATTIAKALHLLHEKKYFIGTDCPGTLVKITNEIGTYSWKDDVSFPLGSVR